MANAPLSGRDGESLELIWVRREEKYFLEWGWTAGSKNTRRANHLDDGNVRSSAIGKPHSAPATRSPIKDIADATGPLDYVEASRPKSHSEWVMARSITPKPNPKLFDVAVPIDVQPNGGILFRTCEPVSMFPSELQETLGTRQRIARAVIDRDIAKETSHPHRRHAKHGGGPPLMNFSRRA